MKATIDKKFQVAQPIDKVWAYLSNPEKVVTCVPGASLTEKVDEDNYKGMVSLKLGPVSAKYNGEIQIKNLDPASYHMEITGKGTDTKGKGSAGMTMNGKLNSLDAQNTEVGYQMEVSVTGKLAQFGSRLIVDVSDQLANQFIDSFKSALETEPNLQSAAVETTPSGDNSLNAFAMFWTVIKSFFAGLFGRKKGEE